MLVDVNLLDKNHISSKRNLCQWIRTVGRHYCSNCSRARLVEAIEVIEPAVSHEGYYSEIVAED